MFTEIYYQNLLKDRKYVMYLLKRDWPAVNYFRLSNGRRLNRLSTRQLVSKLRTAHRQHSNRRSSYLTWLDGVAQHV
jgi:hypothetical protein